ncbi:enoyl-CoA hydratase/isomerase family protein [Bacillus sp. Marseille-P3661]|uniref:enoyl-CoA hydratase/isomerase family protein n=1 Tax=Bacillus sp. Marseille-P3661 TaxID=1936234 RepID=UPI000C852930|nr:enoyl-CoA hydratase/isomerase family protein [Bacillus sp. Marseille-P3661]
MNIQTVYKTIYCETNEHVATIILDRPTVMNAINRQMALEVLEALTIADTNEQVKVVVIRGSNGHFSAGVDLKEVYDLPQPIGAEPSEVWREHLESLLAVSIKLWELTKPTIAVVEGHALGGAADWVLSTDLALAADTAKIGEPEIQFGAAPPTLMLPWVVGIRKTKELLFTGDTISAQEALQYGIYNKVAPTAQLENELTKLTNKISKIPASALKLTKKSINKTYELQHLRDALDYNLETSISMFFLKQEREVAETAQKIREKGLKAFLQNVSL